MTDIIITIIVATNFEHTYLLLACVYVASNPGPLRRGPGIYCMGDSAHAQLGPPESGGFVHASKPS